MVGNLYYIRDAVAGNSILYPLIITLLTIILAWTTMYVFEGLIKSFKNRSRKLNLKLISVLETPLIIIIILIGVQLSVRRFILEHDAFNKVMLTVLVIVTTYVLIRVGSIILDFWSTGVSHSKGEEFHSEILPLSRSVLSIIMSILGVLIILQVWQVEIATLVTSLGVASVVLGFAFKQTLENIFGGISLIVDNSFKKGDLVRLPDGEIGEVMEINLRSTKMKTFDAEALIMPNSLLANNKLTNLAQPTPTVRIKIPVSVAYGSDPERVKAILHDSLRNNKDVLTMPRRKARFVGFGQSSIDFELFFYINDYTKIWDIKDMVLSQLYKDLYKEGIEIPFPIRTIVQAKKGQYEKQWEDVKG